LSYRVLLIDDDCEEHFFIAEAFKQLDEKSEIISLEGGEKALKHLGDGDTRMPDLILLDINMPGMDGFSVLKRFKSDLKTKHIPVYMLSTSDSPDDMARASKLGAAGYYCKPFSLQGYREIAKNIMKEQGK
jgi:DNA-binding response OmpR family regulator